MYKKPMANIMLKGEKFEAIPWNSTLFNFMLLVLYGARRQEKEIKGILTEKEVKLSVFVDDIVLYIRDPQNFYQKTPRNNKLQQCGRIRNQTAQINSFSTHQHTYGGGYHGHIPIHNSLEVSKISRNESNQLSEGPLQ